MSPLQRGAWIGLLTLGVAALLAWATHHAEVSFADGLRAVNQARRIAQGDLKGGLLAAIEHPMHPLAIASVHAVLGLADTPYGWQTAAQVASALALVLATIPLYRLARDLFDDDTTATLAVLLVMGGPVVIDTAVNVLSESTFLLLWAWGLWSAVRFLRDGVSIWLVPAIGFGALAYWTRPEGVLLHLSLVATLVILPLHRGTRIEWPRWWAAVAALVIGPILLVGPYMALKGGVGTRPAVARLIGTEPEAPPEALERERPLPADQSTLMTYGIAVERVERAIRGALRWPLVPFAVVGLVVAFRRADRGQARAWLLLSVMGLVAALGLVRLHATGGYCTVRHALIPATILTLAAAHGLGWVMRHLVIQARWLGLGEGRLQPGALVWALVLGSLVALPLYRGRTPFASSFAPYRLAGSWLAGVPEAEGQVLDLTDWSLFFSGLRGEGFARVLDAAAAPETRFVLVRDVHRTGHLHYNEVVRRLVAGRQPVARFPEQPAPRQIQIEVYDLAQPVVSVTRAASAWKESQ